MVCHKFVYRIKNNLKKYHHKLFIMEEENLVKYLKCPLTKLFFSEPVLADDGYFYEFMSIKNHISKSNMSPVTNSKMGNMIVKAPMDKNNLNTRLILLLQARLIDDKKPFYLFRNEFFDIIKKKQFSKLNEFTSIVLNTETNDDNNTTVFELICKDCDDVETINYIVDESIDFDVYDKRGMKPVHIICRHSPIECLQHILDKDIDVNAVDNNNDNIKRITENPKTINTTNNIVITNLTVLAEPPTIPFHIYNIFSPNGDNVNDTWVIDGIEIYSENKIIIFNRWEDEVARFNGYDNVDVVWNGTNKNGRELPIGTYFYVIELGDQNYSGWVEISR